MGAVARNGEGIVKTTYRIVQRIYGQWHTTGIVYDSRSTAESVARELVRLGAQAKVAEPDITFRSLAN